MEVPWKVYCNIPTIIYAFSRLPRNLSNIWCATVWQKPRKLKPVPIWLDYRTVKAIDWTHSWCSMNPFWSRKRDWDLSLQFCPHSAMQCDSHINVLRSTLFCWKIWTASGDRIVTYERHRIGVQFPVCLSAKLNWPWDCFISSTCFPLPFLSVKT